ncbi:hypothetical protein KSP40_PGU019149 [Platanthera guangdongensis]|uniref:Uncharacterized protein n=1 Tax=Platanthera guangdongensis TaxID=2320717 RepID=A0ABR2M3L1_9ASPA
MPLFPQPRMRISPSTPLFPCPNSEPIMSLLRPAAASATPMTSSSPSGGIVPPLSRLIGNYFFKKNKVPLAINISRRGWPEAVREACRSTLLHLRSGTCSGLKVGRVSMDRDQIVDNLMATINAAVERIPKKWANIRCMHIMSVQSAALPIYQDIPEIGMRIDLPPRETDVKREAEENKKKHELSKKRKSRIHDVGFTCTDLHDRSEEG